MPNFVKEFWTLAAPFCLVVAACFLFGYWGALGINALEFIGASDVLKLAVYPLAVSVAFYGLGILLSEILYRPYFPVGGGEHTPIGQFGRRYARPLLATLLALIVAIVLWLPGPYRWVLIAPLLIPFGTALTHQDWAIALVPNPTARSNIFHILVVLPVLAFGYGQVNAEIAASPKTGKAVNIQRSSLKLIESEGKPVLYLGLLGDTFILLETSTGLTVFCKRSDAPLILRTMSGT